MHILDIKNHQRHEKRNYNTFSFMNMYINIPISTWNHIGKGVLGNTVQGRGNEYSLYQNNGYSWGKDKVVIM